MNDLARFVRARLQEEGDAAQEVRLKLCKIGQLSRLIRLANPCLDLVVYPPKLDV